MNFSLLPIVDVRKLMGFRLKSKIGFFMKLNFVVLVLMTLSLQLAATNTHGQDINEITVTIKMEDGTLPQLINALQTQTGLSFGYTPDHAKEVNGINLSGDKMTVKEVLDAALHGTRLGYKQRKNFIAIFYKDQVRTGQTNAIENGNEESTSSDIQVTGKVVDNKTATALPGVNVLVKGNTIGTSTDAQGVYSLMVPDENSILTYSFIGFKTVEVPVNNRSSIDIELEEDVNSLQEVIVFPTGYDNVSAERTTGSFTQIDGKLLERNVGTDIISRLNGTTPSLVIDQRTGNKTFLNIRGFSTILANDQPLIVVDNFPYNGDISTINPNDVESITVLRDAAAASIWGVRAGNGVIVITTKRGMRNQPLQVSISSNVTIGEKPDLFYAPRMSTAELVGVERDLFNKGYYDGTIDNTYENPVLSPVVVILLQLRNGEITEEQAGAQIATLSKNDVRKEISKHFYQKSINQQYAVNLSGGSDRHNYYFSAGYDKNKSSLIRNQDERVSLNFQNNFKITNHLSLDSRLVYTQSNSSNNNNLGEFSPSVYSYTKFTDDAGAPTIIPYRFRNEFLEQTNQNGFLDWSYNPLQELNRRDITNQVKNVRSATGLSYEIIPGLSADAKYQYESQTGASSDFFAENSYYSRNLINSFTVFDGKTITSRNIPLGAIISKSNSEMKSHNGRLQLNYVKEWSDHNVTTIAGFEVRQIRIEGTSGIQYGYDKNLGSFAPINYATSYPTYPSGAYQFVNNGVINTGTIDRFRSYFGNAAYTYKRKYTISGSARIDQSNLFGVNTNQRSAPLWSVGGKWNIKSEGFLLELKFLSALGLRATYGFNGNIAQNVTAFTTAQFYTAQFSQRQAAFIVNPPNPNLTWERSRMLNLGLDFGVVDNHITGRIEYYSKKGIDLIGQGPIDPTQGISVFKGNIASMKGSGWDIELTTKNIDNAFKWQTNVSFSYIADEVTDYKLSASGIGAMFADNSLTRSPDQYAPIKGRPLFGVYSIPWAGLEPETGAPRGYLNGFPSTEYNTIYASYTVDSLKYHGRATPSALGFIRNTLDYKGISLSVNLSYRFGYFFRRSSINYSDLYSRSTGHSDYSNRWTQPSDETKTNVPSEAFPANQLRDVFYLSSETLVDKADNIRVQDVRLAYSLPTFKVGSLNINRVEVYSYMNNIGILWKSTTNSIDPDFPSIPLPRTIAIGTRIIF